MGINLETFSGAPDGMARAVAQHELADTSCWTLIDAFVNQPGLITRRAGLSEAITSLGSAYAIGLAGTLAPDGTWVGVQLVRRTTGPSGGISGFKNDTSLSFDWPSTPGIDMHELFDSKDALKGGAFIGSASELGKNPTQSALALWRGAGKPLTTAKTLSANVARGDLTVALTAGGSDFSPGHFVFNATDQLIGVVKSISGDTLTLEDRALATETTTVYGTPMRGINPRVSKGRITTSATSTQVNGGNTQFRKLGLGSGTWDIFTTDLVYVGTVDTVTSDVQLELTGNAAVDLLNSDYLAIKRTGSYSIASPAVGFLNASFAGHQFYAKGNTVFYSDDDDPEALDLVDDSFVFSADSVSALIPAESALLVCSSNETFALTGAVGTLPDRWAGERIHDDGCLCPMTAAPYEGGAIWAGRRGIWYWNGSDPVNIAGSLGELYQRLVGDHDGRLYGMVHADHYFLHIEETANTEVKVIAPGSTGDQTALGALTIVVNLKTGALSVITNHGIRGWAKPPIHVGDGETYFSATTNLAGTRSARVFQASHIFSENAPAEGSAIDAYDCEGWGTGSTYAGSAPWFTLETKKYDLGNPQILKLFKLLLIHFRLWGSENTQEEVDAETADHLRFSTSKGIGDDAVALVGKKLYLKPGASFPGSWQDKRVKFMKRSQHLSIRMFQGTDTITSLQLGSWAIGFKQKRPGRV